MVFWSVRRNRDSSAEEGRFARASLLFDGFLLVHSQEDIWKVYTFRQLRFITFTNNKNSISFRFKKIDRFIFAK